MKNPFHFFRSFGTKEPVQPEKPPEPNTKENISDIAPNQSSSSAELKKDLVVEDTFEEWYRTPVKGGIERRERNDIFEMYQIYGAKEGVLCCRRYHRYPEHERDFSLSYHRKLSFDDFNRRLLSELDTGGIPLEAYFLCMEKAQTLTCAARDTAQSSAITEEDKGALRGFCESLDNLVEKNYRFGEGVFHCEGKSAVGDEALILRFRGLLPHDAVYQEVAGVLKEKIDGFDIENMWILGIYNRLRERSDVVTIFRLTSLWSLNKESVLLFSVRGLDRMEGELLIAVSSAENMSRFGFYSLDFSGR